MGLKPVHFLGLNDSLTKVTCSEARQEQAEGGDHGHHAEIGGRQQPGQDDRGIHPQRERQRRGGYRRCRGSNDEAPQFAAFGYRVERTAGGKWDHFFSWVSSTFLCSEADSPEPGW